MLSAGHASALLYGLLHLAGFDLPIDELRRFRQLGSRTPGHPEHGLTSGVETTTGPLGQGLSNAVGIAIAERMLAAHFNRPGFDLFDHRTFVIASDGDLMEGVASEACSLAGHLGLGKLIVFYDSNAITIDGSTVARVLGERDRFASRPTAGTPWRSTTATISTRSRPRLDAAIAESGRPSLVRVRTHIGFGSPGKQDSAEAHGAALGPAEVKATKTNLGWPLEPTFLVPDEARAPVPGSGRARSRRARRVERTTRGAGRRRIPTSPPSSSGGSRERCRRGGRRGCRSYPPGGARDRDALRLRRGDQRARAASPRAVRRLRRPRRVEQHHTSRAPRISRRSIPKAGTCASACASTRWRRSSTA